MCNATVQRDLEVLQGRFEVIRDHANRLIRAGKRNGLTVGEVTDALRDMMHEATIAQTNFYAWNEQELTALLS